jgi:selenide,water dikinase
MVGSDTSDDAAVYRINDELALIQTVDFFTPIVDDPYDFGRIAAANALSDVYAMGGKPVLALSILAFPSCLSLDVLGKIVKGGSDKIREAGAHIAGGHTVDDVEPKFGFAVTGFVHPDRVLTNAGVFPGDFLILTKPLGTGIITTSLKAEMCDPSLAEEAIQAMTALNDQASELAQSLGAHAATDITGFGLLGHSLNMAELSHVTLEFWFDRIPLFSGVTDLAAMGMVPGGAYKNKEFIGRRVIFSSDLSDDERLILFDPQTSGGLLFAVSPESAGMASGTLTGKPNELKEISCTCLPQGAQVVGRAVPYDGIPLRCVRSPGDALK